MKETHEHEVVDLVSADVPADQGLSSLGLLMQLAGTLLAAGAIVVSFMGLVEMRGESSNLLFVFFIAAVSCVRSLFHRMAGTELLYGRRALRATVDAPQDYLAGVRRYVAVAFAHTAVIAVAFWLKGGSSMRTMLGLIAGLALWPSVLGLVLASPRFQSFKHRMPITEDKGFEGAAILMAVLGAMGVFFSGLFLLALLQAGKVLAQGPGVLLMLAMIMLVIRSFIHLQAGISGLRETSVERSVELANRYANFGVISSFCAGGALLLLSMATALDVFVLSVVCALVWVLVTWPLIIRRFFSDRQFADLLAGEGATLHRRAPDAGMTGLGWLLIGMSVLAGSLLLPRLINGDSLFGGRLDALMGGGNRSVWWNVGFVMLQGWAGVELVKMSSMRRAVGVLYAVAGSAVQVYLMWPGIVALWHAPRGLAPGAITMAGIALALTIPVTTLILVNRKLTPMARARYRTAKP
jgi:hypothetical protein